MAFGDFSVDDVIERFTLQVSERPHHFGALPEVSVPSTLVEMLDYNLPLAVGSGSEKARSELLVMPVLLAFRKMTGDAIGLFSGVEFNISPDQGLNGTCDYLISGDPATLSVRRPILAIVEAKRDDLTAGLGQCLAELVAARIFNERHKTSRIVYGAVTNGTLWKFLALDGTAAVIDTAEYPLDNAKRLLGILMSFVKPS